MNASRTNEELSSVKPQEKKRLTNNPPPPQILIFLLSAKKNQTPIGGIFKRGVMVGALVLLTLNRLQMLKESRGQECKRPDGEERIGGWGGHRTLATPPPRTPLGT